MIPAKPYMHKVMMWALSNGMKYFTVKDQKRALANYELFAATRN